MRLFLAVLFAVVAASLAPPIAFAIWLLAESGKMAISFLPLVFIAGTAVSCLHVLVLGLPATGWLLKIGSFRFFPMLAAGFVIGSVPALLWRGSNWAASQDSLIGNLSFAIFAGLLGGLSSTVFFFVYRGLSPNNSFKPTPLRGSA